MDKFDKLKHAKEGRSKQIWQIEIHKRSKEWTNQTIKVKHTKKQEVDKCDKLKHAKEGRNRQIDKLKQQKKEEVDTFDKLKYTKEA